MSNNEIFITDGERYYVKTIAVSENRKFYPKSGYKILYINLRSDLKNILTNKTYPRYSRDLTWGTLKNSEQDYEIIDSPLYPNNKLGDYSYLEVDKKTFTKLKLKL